MFFLKKIISGGGQKSVVVVNLVVLLLNLLLPVVTVFFFGFQSTYKCRSQLVILCSILLKVENWREGQSKSPTLRASSQEI